MKNREQFKSSIYKKLERYNAKKITTRRMWFKLGTPLAACFILACVFFSGSILDIFATKDFNGITQSDDTKGFIPEIITFEIMPSSTDVAESERTYTDTVKIEKISNYIDSLRLSDFNGYIEEINNDGSIGVSYTITFTYIDSIKNVYVNFNDCLIMTNDSEWKKMEYDQAITLESLIKELTGE